MRWQLLILTLLLNGASQAVAAPSVERLLPPAAQRGTTFTLTLDGARLNEPLALLFYTPGLTCTKLLAKSDQLVEATITCRPDVPLGEHALQLVTKSGASQILTFQLTPFPIVQETEPNDLPSQAQRVSLNSTIFAVADSADSDYYSITLKAGQRLSAEVVGVRLGAQLTDTTLTLLSPTGEVLAKVDDRPLFRQDPFLSYIAPQDGEYRLLVHHATFGGSTNHIYLLHVGSFPRPQAIYPLGGQAGTSQILQFLGDQASGSGTTLKLPDAARASAFTYFPNDAQGTAPTAHPFRVSPFPNVNEVEPNDQPSQGGPAVAWPVAFNGVISRPGDADHFRFRGRRGDTIELNSYAYRLGTPVDTVLEVLDSTGQLLGQNDDDETHDSRLTVTLPADGDYLVRVTDKRLQGGPLFVYRVELTKPEPKLSVFLAERERKSRPGLAITIPRGNRVTAHLAVLRDGFTGPVSVEAFGLPTGVTAQLGRVAASEYLLPITLEAKPDAPLGGQLVTWRGSAEQAGQKLQGAFLQELPLVRGPGDSLLHSVSLHQLCITVVEESPAKVKLLPPTLPLVPDSTLSVRYSIERKKGFDEPLELNFPTLPPGIEVPYPIVIGPDQIGGTVTLVASPEADLGDWSIVAELAPARRGRAQRDPLLVGNNGLGTPAPGSRRRSSVSLADFVPVASNLVAVTTQSPQLRGQLKPTLGEQGKSIEIVVDVDLASTKLPTLEAKLEGLPPRATVSPVSVTPQAKQIRFAVKLDPTTPVGEVDSLICELSGTQDGQSVVYRVGRGGKLRVVAPGELRTDAQGRPLSPLEVLRQREKHQEKKNP